MIEQRIFNDNLIPFDELDAEQSEYLLYLDLLSCLASRYLLEVLDEVHVKQDIDSPQRGQQLIGHDGLTERHFSFVQEVGSDEAGLLLEAEVVQEADPVG